MRRFTNPFDDDDGDRPAPQASSSSSNTNPFDGPSAGAGAGVSSSSTNPFASSGGGGGVDDKNPFASSDPRPLPPRTARAPVPSVAAEDPPASAAPSSSSSPSGPLSWFNKKTQQHKTSTAGGGGGGGSLQSSGRSDPGADARDDPDRSSSRGRSRRGGGGGDDDADHAASAKPSGRQSLSQKLRRPRRRRKPTAAAAARDAARAEAAEIQRWPYDDFHRAQRAHYERRADDASSSANTPSAADASPYLHERPPELPTVRETVRGLPLADFERTATERAVRIVSTWLYDSGIVDELLVRGGLGGTTTSASADRDDEDGRGVEVGPRGRPLTMGDALKVDREVERLRSATRRRLTTINNRLNDGVAGSGAEVQELVNAVAATKGDLGRLRQFSSYVESNSRKGEFLLSNYPRLKTASHARRNLFRCFRELEFFSQISSTCNRLREEMHSGEWTEDEWSTVRSVCMEHVELQTMLMEAEAGVHSRLMADGEENDGGRDSYVAVDRFLAEHVKNVWELGEEIRLRVLSGIGGAFQLAAENPAGMVALCEAVEVYERAEEHFDQRFPHRHRDSGDDTPLRFTNIRADALAQIHKDFEVRGQEVFRRIHERQRDVDAEAEDDDDPAAANNPNDAEFSNVLRGATELVTNIDLVRHRLAPCFPPHWNVEILWSSCVAHVCSNQIVQQIGGPDGERLDDLTTNQLLDLVAWVEYFRDHVEESFPRIAGMRSTESTYFNARPDLFSGNGRTVDVDKAADGLAWANNMLWEVHRLAQSGFLERVRTQTERLLENVYGAEPEPNQASDGRLTSSLPEDVFSLVSVQLRTFQEHLSPTSDALVAAVCLVFDRLRARQTESRDDFLRDLESCCASANDFARMSEKCEELLRDLLRQTQLSDDSIVRLEAVSSDLLSLYSSDAVHAAQRTHEHVFGDMEESIAEEFFSREWEETMTDNELARTIVRTLEDYVGDLERFLDDFLVKKTIEALVAAAARFYVRCLLGRAERHAGTKEPAFADVPKALDRYKADVVVLREYFASFVPRSPPLGRIVEREFEILTTIHEIMTIAAQSGDASDFVIVVHKRVGDVDATRRLFADLWHLVNPQEEKAVWDFVGSMEDDLAGMGIRRTDANDRSVVPNLRLDSMMTDWYKKTKRKLPGAAKTWMGTRKS